MMTGMVLNMICVAAALASTGLVAFYVALLCLGVGWNFMFVGGTTLLAQSYRPSERAKTQGMAELMRYTTTAIATLAAGPVLSFLGWSLVNVAILPVVALAAAMTLWWRFAERRSLVPAVA
jgi:MFS family permease